MSGAHSHPLYRHGHSVVHGLPAQLKLVAVLVCAFAIVTTPRERLWAFAAYVALLATAATAARLPVSHLLRGLTMELPFVAFAVLLPFVTPGEGWTVLGLSVSANGLWDAWNIVAKATLCLGCSLILASTTSMYELLLGIQRLKAPSILVQILTFMVRYLDVTGAELDRMRVARASRGFEPRRPRHWGVLARSAGALFIRSYERGERVHLAMLSRGYTGDLPMSGAPVPTTADRVRALVIPALTVATAALSWVHPL